MTADKRSSRERDTALPALCLRHGLDERVAKLVSAVESEDEPDARLPEDDRRLRRLRGREVATLAD